MKRVSTIILALFVVLQLTAQPKEVTLVVTGEGATKEEATNNALRSAVEQAFGVFVSANTDIFNDEIIKDEIATVSSGNIKSYQEITSISSPNGRVMVTLNTVVSLGQLVSFAQNHGASTEFAGSTFGANMRLYELNKQAQQKALNNLYSELSALSSTMFDYRLEVGEPVAEGSSLFGVRNPSSARDRERGVYVPMTVKVVANANTKAVGDFFLNTIKSISCGAKDIRPFSTMGMESFAYYSISFNDFLHKASKNLKFGIFPSPSEDAYRTDPRPQGRQSVSLRPTKPFVNEPMYFYSKIESKILNDIFLSAVYNFEIRDNLGATYRFDIPTDIKDDVRMNPSSGEFMFDEIAGDNMLLTGVYSISNDYGGPKRVSEFLEENAVFMGIVSSNLKFAPGKDVYIIRKTVLIDKETVYKISGFEISPRH